MAILSARAHVLKQHSETESDKTEPCEAESEKTEPVEAEPQKNEPVEAEPQKTQAGYRHKT